jgi:2-polyprenyl-3-methyl-5-hydroxy-6-metoxy-1,4-benzoquinol methylase
MVPGTFSLFRCKSCECVFQHPLPEATALAKFYPQEYWWSEESKQKSLPARLFSNLERTYREFVAGDHVRFLDSCARENASGGKLLLDIGCGSGTFLHLAQAHGYIPHGMDISAKAVEIAHRQYGYPARQGEIGSSIWDDCRFDFITMFHVLEHLREPRQALKYAGQLLRPGGLLIIQVPNISSMQARLFKTRWYGLVCHGISLISHPKLLGFCFRRWDDFELVPRFSLRDNPASIASSLVPWLDPIRRKGGAGCKSNPQRCDGNGLLRLFLFSLPAALLESLCGYAGTIWAFARYK